MAAVLVQKILVWIGAAAAATILLCVVLFAYVRLRGPTAEQSEALALLDARSPMPGRNAFAAIWLLPFDVPDSEIEALAEEDVRRFKAAVASGLPDAVTAFESAAAKRYGRAEVPQANAKGSCDWKTVACLHTVRAAPGLARAYVEKHAALIRRVQRLGNYGHYLGGFPPGPESPLPSVSHMHVALTAYALAFVDGQRDAALNGTCAHLAQWRRLVANSDSLVVSMVAISRAQASAVLLADMLAELPRTYALPSTCPAALGVPRVDESLLCEAMRGEHRFVSHEFRKIANEAKSNYERRIATGLLFDTDISLATMAPVHAWTCTPAARETVVAGERATPPALPGVRVEFIGDPGGQILASIIGSSNWAEYYQRAQDHDARMRLLAAVAWLRGTGPEQSATRSTVDRLPSTHRIPGRAIEVADDGRAISVRMFNARFGKRWQLPLAASRLASHQRSLAAASKRATSSR